MGFRGETCFVKPGYAFNYLVPNRKALFADDPSSEGFLEKINKDDLKKKQDVRNLEIFLEKLKDIKLIFTRETSDINKNVAKVPVTA